MARYYAHPNPYSRILDRKFTRQVLILVTAILGVALAFFVSDESGVLAVTLALLVVIFSVVAARRIHLSFSRNDRGSDAEHEVRDLLKGLPGNYAVFQNVPILDGLDIDFVVVGPNGVIAVEVKSHKRYRRMSGSEITGFRQAKAEAMALKDYLARRGVRVFVSAMLVFTRARPQAGSSGRGVLVITKDWLVPAVLRTRPVEYDQALAERAVRDLFPSPGP